MPITLIMLTIPQVFAYVQIHQIVHMKYVQFFVFQLYLNKAAKKQTKTPKLLIPNVERNKNCLWVDY